MTIPAKFALRGRRNAFFGQEWQFTADTELGAVEPVDLTGHTAFLQLRLYGAQPGSAKVNLPSVSSNIEGVWIIAPTEGRIQVYATEASMAAAYTALSGGVEAGANIRLQYDLVIRDPMGWDDVWVEGDFTINPGVTV
ncbi:MAG: hypothetical protein ACSLE1_01975 [Sphingobium sp.]